MLKPLPVLAAFVLLIFSGLVHGWWSERWKKSAELEDAAQRVSLVPRDVGDWKGEDQQADEREFAQAGAQGYWVRRYARKNQVLTVILMCGRSGRMSVHTPEICYQGLGYDMAASPTHVDVPLGDGRKPAEFWSARFVKQLGSAGDLRLFWSWKAQGSWKAPSSPRWQFWGDPFLYKLYIVHSTSPGNRVEEEPAVEFLRQFLPVLEKTLSSPQPERNP